MLRDNKPHLELCNKPSPMAAKVANLFIQLLSIPVIRDRITSTLEVETHGWTLKQFSIEDVMATMAYDGERVRCLSIATNSKKLVSVLTSDLESVEPVFIEWAEGLLMDHCDASIGDGPL